VCVWHSVYLLYWDKCTNTDAACVSATSACRRASGLAPSVWAKVLVVYLLYWYKSTNILTLRALSCKTPGAFVLFVPVVFVLLYQQYLYFCTSKSKATATVHLYVVPVTDSASPARRLRREAVAAHQFTCFIGTIVQILTL
jgi:hypothetical protein